MNNQYQDREVCLYYLKIQKELARGIIHPENPFPDKNCLDCKVENQSQILCYHYFNEIHHQEFKKLFGAK